MGWLAVKSVWFKELVDTVRDKRTLYVMVLLPLVLMPLIFVAGPVLMTRQQEALQESLPYALFVGGSEAEALAAVMGEAGVLETTVATEFDPTEAEASVREREYDVVVYVGQSEGEAPVALEVIYESRRGGSSHALQRLNGFLQHYSTEVAAERLEAMGLSRELMEPYRMVGVRDVTTEEDMGGLILGMILPFLISMWAVMGGMYTAIDVAAGEKERGTLESLLMTPVPRRALVVGKLLAVVTVSFVANLLMIISMVFSALYLLPALMGGEAFSLSFQIEPVSVLLMIVLMFLFIVMTSALLLVFSAFGKSFREAQSYTTALTFAVMVPGMYFAFVQEIQVADWVYAVPVFNVLLTLKNLLEGIVDWTALGITMLSLLVFAALSVVASFRIFTNERIVFRS